MKIVRVEVALLGLLMASATSGAACSAQSVPRWSVEPVATVTVGTIAGPPEYTLLNPQRGMVLSDGTIVIQNSNRGLFEIRYYRPDGTYLATASRWGQGPFEFQRTLSLHRSTGDSVVVTGQDGRFAVFGPSGEREREGRTGIVSLQPVSLALGVDDRHLALMKSWGPRMPKQGRYRGSYLWLIYDRQDGSVDTAGTARGVVSEVESGPNGSLTVPEPFSPWPQAAAGRGMLWVGETDSPEIRGYGTEGRLVLTVQVPFQDRAVTRSDRERVREAYSSRFRDRPDLQKRWAAVARRLEFPARMPYYEQLRVDRAGNLWVQEYEPAWATGSQRWTVFAQSGAMIAVAEVPASALPACARVPLHKCLPVGGILEIGPDYVLVSQTDALGVQYVRKYRIVKPQ